MITGIIPANTIITAAFDASAIFSSEANSNALTERVLKLNGLNIEVSGNSFITSIKTKRKLVSNDVLSKGK